MRSSAAVSILAALMAVGCSAHVDPEAADAAPPDVAPIANFDLVYNGATFLATSQTNPAFQVEVDCDDGTDDEHFNGITPIIAGKRLEIDMYGGTTKFPLLTPDFDAGVITCAGVDAHDDTFHARLHAGTYRTFGAEFPDMPVPLDATFHLDPLGRLVVDLSGIYYMLPTAANTTLHIIDAGAMTRTVDAATPMFTEFYDNATRVKVDDSIYGTFVIDGLIPRLQVQQFDGSHGFELDLDHNVSEAKVLSVAVTLTFL